MSLHKVDLHCLKRQILSLSQAELLERFKKYFSPEEIVTKHVFDDPKRGGSRVYRMMDMRLMANVLFMREALNRKFKANNWSRGGKFDERGYRDPLSEMNLAKVKDGKLYLSAHNNFMGMDFIVDGLNSQKVREWAKENEEYFPYHCRFEHMKNGYYISWVHIDVYFETKNPKVYLFNI